MCIPSIITYLLSSNNEPSYTIHNESAAAPVPVVDLRSEVGGDFVNIDGTHLIAVLRSCAEVSRHSHLLTIFIVPYELCVSFDMNSD